MDRKRIISMVVIRRLPKYHRYLFDLLNNNIKRISSKELSEKIGFTASQIRQDLTCFGEFGQQGYGYNVKELYSQISNILGLSKSYKIVVIGAGNIGRALTNNTIFERYGMKLECIFDTDPKLIGLKIKEIEIRDLNYLPEFLLKNQVDIGVICVPSVNAQNVCDILTHNGVKGIWNFAPVDLITDSDITIENVYLIDSLFTLTCLLIEK